VNTQNADVKFGIGRGDFGDGVGQRAPALAAEQHPQRQQFDDHHNGTPFERDVVLPRVSPHPGNSQSQRAANGPAAQGQNGHAPLHQRGQHGP